MTTTCQIGINAPPETVFNLIADPALHGQWLRGVESTVFEPGSDPTRAGAKFTQRIKEGDKVRELQGEVLAYDKPWQYGIVLRGGAYTVEVYYRLAPQDSGTRLSFSCEFITENRFFRLLGRVLGWFMGLAVSAQLQQLKQLAEKPA